MNYIPLKDRSKQTTEPSELQLQSDAFLHLTNNYPPLRGRLFHVPNGGSRGSIEGMQLKAAGVVPGIADLQLMWFGRIYPVEAKKLSQRTEPRGGCSIEQVEIHLLWAQHGVKTPVLYTSQEIVDYYLGITGLVFGG
jgi:hypothetical protein